MPQSVAPDVAFLAIAALRQAMALHQQGDLAGAEAGYREALSLDPRQPFALQLLGAVLNQTGRLEEALARLDAAAALAPQLVDAHFARGETLIQLRRHADALQAYGEAIRLQPQHFGGWKGRGRALSGLGRFVEALESFDRALAIAPDDADTLALRAEALTELRLFPEAFATVQKALQLAPDCAAAWLQCGTLLHNFGQMSQALICFETAVANAPGEVRAWNGRAVALGRLRRFDEAMAAFEDALARAPGNFEARFQRACLHLTRGDFAAAWLDYEARFAARPATANFTLAPLPVWRGEPIAGKRILIHDEQGYGDVIQFCRYLLEVEARGAEVTIAVRAGLVRLLQSLAGDVKVKTPDRMFEGFDYQCPLMSLPLALGAEFASIPGNAPYLKADPERVAWWRNRLGGGFKVGIVWSASLFGQRDGRSVALAEFAGLSRIEGVRLVSLQKELGVEMLRVAPAGMNVEELGPAYDAGDFLETAAVVEALDLVICVDTAIAHLAGALGRPVWVALPYISDWRWFLDRSDSPWYPNLRLFRSRAYNDWNGVFADMETELRALAQADRAPRRLLA